MWWAEMDKETETERDRERDREREREREIRREFREMYNVTKIFEIKWNFYGYFFSLCLSTFPSPSLFLNLCLCLSDMSFFLNYIRIFSSLLPGHHSEALPFDLSLYLSLSLPFISLNVFLSFPSLSSNTSLPVRLSASFSVYQSLPFSPFF